MYAIAITAGLVLGALAAAVWHALARRSNPAPLYAALGRSVRAMLSDDGRFLREYGVLLGCTGSFVLWNALALAAALAPLLLLLVWLSWLGVQGRQIPLVGAYSLASLAGILWLRRRDRHARASEARGLDVSDSQYFFMQVAEAAPSLVRRCETFETRLLRRRLDTIEVDRPVFVTGLARSGTTMLLEVLAQARDVATHRYRDFPFLMTPYLWSHFFGLFGATGEPVQRPHQDGIRITAESPEAFEERIWRSFFAAVHRPGHCHVLDGSCRNEEFDRFFADHLRKILLIRRGRRYLSKGNYNVTRIEYIASLFPGARFVVPIRHPITHVASLVRQHELFCGYSRRDGRVPQYLAAAGHFEFGPQRMPIAIGNSAEQTLAAWHAGDEHRGYALQWAAVYGYVRDLLQRAPRLTERVMVVRYEDICSDPPGAVARILQHVGLVDEGSDLLGHLGHIRKATRPRPERDATSAAVWAATAGIASAFGYNDADREASPLSL